MAKEYRRLSDAHGTLQWRDLGAGVQGWNNIEPDEEPASQKRPAVKPPTPAPTPRPAPTPTAAPAPAQVPIAPPVDTPLAGLTAIDPTAKTAEMPTPLTAGGASQAGIDEPQPATGVATDALGQLRALGRRTFPMNGAVFQGLRSIY